MEVNYFEFYGLPVSFNVDEKEIKRKFYELSKRYHPDFYVSEPEEKQNEILELSTLNNKAYQVLSSPLKRIEYVLSSYNLLEEGDKYTLPQEFLMEMMDVNEALMELQFESDPVKLMEISTQIDELEKSIFEELKLQTDQFDEAQEKEPILLRIRDIWYREKYLMRIRESLNKMKV